MIVVQTFLKFANFSQWGSIFSYRQMTFLCNLNSRPFLGCFPVLLAKFGNFGFLNGGMAKENKVAPLMKKAIFILGPP